MPELRFVPYLGSPESFEAVVLDRRSADGAFDLPLPEKDEWCTVPQSGERKIQVQVFERQFYFTEGSPPDFDVWLHCTWDGAYE